MGRRPVSRLSFLTVFTVTIACGREPHGESYLEQEKREFQLEKELLDAAMKHDVQRVRASYARRCPFSNLTDAERLFDPLCAPFALRVDCMGYVYDKADTRARPSSCQQRPM